VFLLQKKKKKKKKKHHHMWIVEWLLQVKFESRRQSAPITTRLDFLTQFKSPENRREKKIPTSQDTFT